MHAQPTRGRARQRGGGASALLLRQLWVQAATGAVTGRCRHVHTPFARTRTHARTRARTHAGRHARTHARTHAHTHTHTNTRTHTRTHTRTRTLASGKKMPPARAATEGIAGESTASPSTSEYVRPSVVLPKAATWRARARVSSQRCVGAGDTHARACGVCWAAQRRARGEQRTKLAQRNPGPAWQHTHTTTHTHTHTPYTPYTTTHTPYTPYTRTQHVLGTRAQRTME
jgi:hypothetical protein